MNRDPRFSTTPDSTFAALCSYPYRDRRKAPTAEEIAQLIQKMPRTLHNWIEVLAAIETSVATACASDFAGEFHTVQGLLIKGRDALTDAFMALENSRFDDESEHAQAAAREWVPNMPRTL